MTTAPLVTGSGAIRCTQIQPNRNIRQKAFIKAITNVLNVHNIRIPLRVACLLSKYTILGVEGNGHGILVVGAGGFNCGDHVLREEDLADMRNGAARIGAVVEGGAVDVRNQVEMGCTAAV